MSCLLMHDSRRSSIHYFHLLNLQASLKREHGLREYGVALRQELPGLLLTKHDKSSRSRYQEWFPRMASIVARRKYFLSRLNEFLFGRLRAIGITNIRGFGFASSRRRAIGPDTLGIPMEVIFVPASSMVTVTSINVSSIRKEKKAFSCEFIEVSQPVVGLSFRSLDRPFALQGDIYLP